MNNPGDWCEFGAFVIWWLIISPLKHQVSPKRKTKTRLKYVKVAIIKSKNNFYKIDNHSMQIK